MSDASVFRGFDFTGTDWSDRNSDIASRIGADPSLVAAARRHFGMGTARRVAWDDVDLGRPLAEIAEEQKVSVSSVAKAKQSRMLTRSRVDWSCADWTRTNAELASEYECTVSAVIMARKRLSGGITSRQASAMASEGSGRKAPEDVRAGKARAAMESRSARTLSVLFNQEDFDAISDASESSGRSKADVVRTAVSEWRSRRQEKK